MTQNLLEIFTKRDKKVMSQNRKIHQPNKMQKLHLNDLQKI